MTGVAVVRGGFWRARGFSGPAGGSGNSTGDNRATSAMPIAVAPLEPDPFDPAPLESDPFDPAPLEPDPFDPLDPAPCDDGRFEFALS